PLAGPDHLAYCIYTSGSTGSPKGVEISRSALNSYLQASQTLISLDAGDAWAAVTPLTFDISAFEIFQPLLRGARIVVVPALAARDRSEMDALIRREGVTVMQATPAGWQLLTANDVSPLRVPRILVGGDALGRELAERLLRSGEEVWNLYGPTEATIWACANRIRSGEEPTLGRPLPNSAIAILDSEGGLAPCGIAGEICIGGAGLARGYLNRPALTAEKFIPDPFGGAGARLYRTGDLGVMRRDGQIAFLGRMDHQVKLRGYRIELGEVEHALQQCAGVQAAVVMASAGLAGEKELAAYLVGEPSTALDAQAISHEAHSLLPAYMVPAAWAVLDRFPLNSNGKIDRRALAGVETVRLAGGGGETASTPYEELFTWVWCELLEREAVGIHDDFFALGGHSLLLTRVMAKANAMLGLNISLLLAFRFPTIAGIAGEVERLHGTAPLQQLYGELERIGQDSSDHLTTT
ncbi:non-ribosomal peptide synthetase, partial [Chromobacterium vaccinii]|uniref:non-ribosomal peptide synthetase n=1 Tax=Chromobacterium vaccinii TaxID=1108595 RepID=UPI000A7F7CF8